MVHITVSYEDGRKECHSLEAPFVVGRSEQCQLRISHWRVAKFHTRVQTRDADCYLEDLGSLAGTRVNGIRVVRYGPIKPTDEVVIGPCLIRFSVRHTYGVSSSNERALASQHTSITVEPNKLKVDASVYRELRKSLHQGLIKALDLRRTDIAALSTPALREYATACARQLPLEFAPDFSETDREELIKLVVNEAVGLGALEPLLADVEVTEIMVNAFDDIYVERNGVLERSKIEFSSDNAVRGIIERIVFPLGRRIDELSPLVDARLTDGSRLNAVIAPISLRGACLTIRKFPKKRPTLRDLAENDTLPSVVADFLSACVKNRTNILVCGGTGSGKTTMLNVLASQIPHFERIVTIEDSAELQIEHPHVVKLEARPSNAEGRGVITIRDLVKNALRMRPDRIVVGEVRGAEAIDMLAAMNTGHEGSLTTLHANSPRDALSRLETLVLLAQSGLPIVAIRDQVAGAIHLIVHQTRLPRGQRVVHSVLEVCGVESGVIQTQAIARFDTNANRLIGTGLMPTLCDRFNLHLEQSVVDWFVGS